MFVSSFDFMHLTHQNLGARAIFCHNSFAKVKKRSYLSVPSPTLMIFLQNCPIKYHSKCSSLYLNSFLTNDVMISSCVNRNVELITVTWCLSIPDAFYTKLIHIKRYLHKPHTGEITDV